MGGGTLLALNALHPMLYSMLHIFRHLKHRNSKMADREFGGYYSFI